MSTPEKTAPSSTISPWATLRRSWADYRRWFWFYLLITAIVSVPIALLNQPNSANTADTTATFATFFMVLALIATVRRQIRGDRRPSLKEAYYGGTANTLAYALASIVWLGFCLLALTVGFVWGVIRLWRWLGRRIVSTGLRVTAWTVLIILAFPLALITLVLNIAGWTVLFIPGLVAGVVTVGLLIVGLPALYVAIRYAFALYVAAITGRTPWVALRYSRTLTNHRRRFMLARLALLAVVALVIGIVIVTMAYFAGLALHSTTLATPLSQLLFNFFELPIITIYLLRLYDQLGGDGVR